MILSVDILKGHQGEPQALANLKGARFSTARARWPGGARDGPLTAHSSRCPFNQPELTAAPFRSLPRAAARFQRSIRPREYSEIDAAEKSIPVAARRTSSALFGAHNFVHDSDSSSCLAETISVVPKPSVNRS